MRLGIGLIMLAVASMSAAVRIEKVAWQGWANCYRIWNGEVELIVTTDVGPRVMRYGFIGGQNLFKEFAGQLGKSGEREYQLRGGHRLWVAPETLGTSWALDNAPVKAAVAGDVLTVTQPVDSAGLEKQLVIRLAPSGTRVEVLHRLRNATVWGVELAPWALTMMAPGGVAITGFPPRGKHPEVLLPTNPLVMWAYTDFSDARWKITKKYLTLRQDASMPEPQKVGLFNPDSWAAYLLGTELFVKRARADAGAMYPDFGSSLEMFTNGEMLELETLGPLQKLGAGRRAEHREEWELRRGVQVAAWTDAALDAALGMK
jgi:hypothetical protein